VILCGARRVWPPGRSADFVSDLTAKSNQVGTPGKPGRPVYWPGAISRSEQDRPANLATARPPLRLPRRNKLMKRLSSRCARLSLELLEDRVVPAFYYVDGLFYFVPDPPAPSARAPAPLLINDLTGKGLPVQAKEGVPFKAAQVAT